jgi:Protein of unknown function (DUF3300)
MKRFQISLAWLMVCLLVSSEMGLEGCSASAPGGSSSAAATNAAPATPASASTAPQDNQNQQQPQQAELPQVDLTPDGLDELMAPVALYPDPVIAVMMQAAVNPQEVMDGGNWLALDANHDLKDAALDQASEKAGFTPVMQALLHYPTVVDMMCTQFDWTKQLGAAYQANPKAVLASVQRLRAQAVDNGALKSGPQMKVDVTQDNGQQVVELKPTDPKVVYVPQYNPDQVFQTTTTTTRSDGTTTTTTTTSGPAPAASGSNTTTVVQQNSGVSTGTAVLIGLLSFGAGIAVGAAISNNNYYYPAWGHGGVWYGPRPYYPPPYHPVYYGGWGGGYHYNRPPYYRNTNIYINNNNNYYNRFNNNNNLNPNYKPRPVPYNNRPGSTYSRNMGSQPANRQGANYRPNNPNANNRPGNANVQPRPGPGNNPGAAQRPATGNNANNWKGQTTYEGRPNNANGQARPGTPNAGANNRIGAGNTPNRNPSGDRGFPQNGGARPTTGNMQGQRPNTGNTPAQRPNTGNTTAQRPANANQPASRPAQTQNRPQPSTNGGAFGGANNAKSDRAAANRGRASMGAPAHQAQPRSAGGGGRKH